MPEEALVTFAGVTKVFVVRDGAAREVKVTPGVRLELQDGERTLHWLEVTAEPGAKVKLTAGDQVVTSGQTQLSDGKAVRVRGE